MNIFNILAGMASILSLIISLLAFKGVRDVKIKVGFKDNSRTKISQKAKGNNIQQVGHDKNA